VECFEVDFVRGKMKVFAKQALYSIPTMQIFFFFFSSNEAYSIFFYNGRIANFHFMLTKSSWEKVQFQKMRGSPRIFT